jgi:hypothetical protein
MTAANVRQMITTSRTNDQLAASARSRRTDPRQLKPMRPLTCHGPVRPGLTRSRRRTCAGYLATSRGAPDAGIPRTRVRVARASFDPPSVAPRPPLTIRPPSTYRRRVNPDDVPLMSRRRHCPSAWLSLPRPPNDIPCSRTFGKAQSATKPSGVTGLIADSFHTSLSPTLMSESRSGRRERRTFVS